MGDNEGDALVVRTDRAVKDFLDVAYEAQQENKKKVRIVMRAKRSRARAGHYLRGNKAPYGYRYVPCAWDDEDNVTDKRLEPETKAYADYGYTTTFASHPYAARQKIMAMYAGGMSPRRIADQLTQQGVPTAAQLHRHGQTSGKWWPWVVLNKIVLAPLNEGILTNFRHTYVQMDADDKHDEDWVQAVPVPLEKQITVTPEWLASLDPIMDEPTAQLIRARREGIIPGSGQRTGVYVDKTLLAGRAACGTCGGGLRVRSYKRRGKVYLYYTCNKHDLVPSMCPGWSLPVWKVDLPAWHKVLDVLGHGDYFPGGHLQVLAERQAERDSREAPGSSLADLRAARARLWSSAERFAQELLRAQSQLARDLIQREIDRLQPEIADADRKIAAAERQAQNRAARRALLANTINQWQRYSNFVYRLSPYHFPEDDDSPVFGCQRGAGCRSPDDSRVPYPCLVDLQLTAKVLNLLGAKFTIGKKANGNPDIGVELTITAATARPWFEGSELDVVDLQSAPPQLDEERRTFAALKSSLPSG
jgi:hypothetical protein